MFYMDSTVYKYLFEELERGAGTHPASLPPALAAGVLLGPDDLKPLERFLRTLGGSADAAYSISLRPLPGADSFFGCLFRSAHTALADILAGEDPQAHLFRLDGIQLMRFLVFCGGNGATAFSGNNVATGNAMACFLTEGLMHAGWCPNAFENEAKHAAHSYFVTVKKSLHKADPKATELVAGYLEAAWLLSRKTDGVRASCQRIPDEWQSESFSWRTGNGHATYIGVRRPAVGLFQVLSKNHDSLPHPFSCLGDDGRVGMTLRMDLEPLLPVSLNDFMEIKRRNFEGHKYVYNCKCGTRADIRWIVVVLNHEHTTYRVDIVTRTLAPGRTKIDAELRLECAAIPETRGRNSFIAKDANDAENTVIRILDTPLEFEFVELEKQGISVFKSSLSLAEPTLKIVSSWARGRDISGINETTLLGMYE
jgi:hypothetical protein